MGGRGRGLLEPLLDGVEGGDGDGVDHGDLLGVVLVDHHHVEVLEVELDPLEVDQLHLVQGDHEGRLGKRKTSWGRALRWEGPREGGDKEDLPTRCS